MSRIFILFGLLFVSVPAASAAQRVELANMSEEQRWDRASYNLSLFATVYLQKGISTGMTPAEVGVELAGHFGPWPAVKTPQDMAQTIFRNWQSWRAMDFRSEQEPDGSIVVIASRPYSNAIERYSHIGVSVDDFDAMFAAFHNAIAEAQGLSFAQSLVDGATVRMTIRRKQ